MISNLYLLQVYYNNKFVMCQGLNRKWGIGQRTDAHGL